MAGKSPIPDDTVARAIVLVAAKDGSFKIVDVGQLLRCSYAVASQRTKHKNVLKILAGMNPAAAAWARRVALNRRSGPCKGSKPKPCFVDQTPSVGDFNGSAPLPDEPLPDALPGSANKLRAMIERAAAGKGVFHPRDTRDARGHSVAPDDAPQVALRRDESRRARRQPGIRVVRTR